MFLDSLYACYVLYLCVSDSHNTYLLCLLHTICICGTYVVVKPPTCVHMYNLYVATMSLTYVCMYICIYNMYIQYV